MDLALIKLAKKGNKEAFVNLINQSKDSMYRVAKGILKNDPDVADAMQDTILIAFEKINSLKKHEYFKTWLIRILINECNKILRLKSKVIGLDEKMVSNKFQNEYQHIEIMDSISTLEEDLRIITVLYYFEDISIKDIALIVGKPEGTIKSKLSRARIKLYDLLKEERLVAK